VFLPLWIAVMVANGVWLVIAVRGVQVSSRYYWLSMVWWLV
jgi:hypothetical protein